MKKSVSLIDGRYNCFVENDTPNKVDADGRAIFSDSGTSLFFGGFFGGGGQVQLTFSDSCCDEENIEYEFTTLEICGGAGVGGWGGGSTGQIHHNQWGNLPCPPASFRTYKKVIGAVTGNFPGSPGGLVTGEIGDEGTDISGGGGLGNGIAVVGCIAITRSSASGRGGPQIPDHRLSLV